MSLQSSTGDFRGVENRAAKVIGRSAARETGTYTVQPGDTLADIAYAFKMKLSELKALNPEICFDGKDAKGRNRTADGDWIYVGEKIAIRGSAKPKPKEPIKKDETDFTGAAVQKAKKILDEAGAKLAETHGRDPEKAGEIMNAALAALDVIPKSDPQRGDYEKKVEDLKGLYDSYFPREEKPEPFPTEGDKTNMRKGVDHFLSRLPKGRAAKAIAHELKENRAYLEVASPGQKARMIDLVLSERANKEGRGVALQLLNLADANGEIADVAKTLKASKRLDELFTRMEDKIEGVQMARMFHRAGVYNDYFKDMDDDASRALLRTLGFTDPPPAGQNADLAALPEAMKQHMISQLSSGNMTWTELHMVQWLNKHVDMPRTVQTVNGPVT